MVVIGLVCLVIFGIVVIVYYNVLEFIERLPYYEEAVRDIAIHLPSWMKSLGGAKFSSAAESTQPDATAITLGSTTLSEMAFNLILESEQVMVKSSLTLLYTVFILMGRQSRDERTSKRTLTVIEEQLRVYISWKFIVSAAVAVLHGMCLSLLRIDLAALFAGAFPYLSSVMRA